MKRLNTSTAVIILMIVFAATSRMIPHPPNFTPIAAMALFGASKFSKKYLAFLIPILALFFSDLFINNVILSEYYTSFQFMGNIYVYIGFSLIAILGILFLKKASIRNIAISSLFGAVIFFIITNFGAWASMSIYPKTLTGLTEAYVAGIPFFRNTLIGTLVYSGVLFGTYELFIAKRFIIA